MTERKLRKDAARNRGAVLAAADTLFSEAESPENITMADVAAAAGVGKGTLFRAFGDRVGLIHAIHAARLEPIVKSIEAGPPPLGRDTPSGERTLAVLDAILCFKFDNRHLALALEQSGSSSPYEVEHYRQLHGLLQSLLAEIVGFDKSSFTAHALLSATRADLVEYLTNRNELSRENAREQLAYFVARVLG